MKKILISLFVFFLLILTVRSQDISDEKLNKQIKFDLDEIYEKYEIVVKLHVVESSADPYEDAKKKFYEYELDKKGNKNWNILIFYAKKQNDLRLVTFKECSIGENALKSIKDIPIVEQILRKEDPSEKEINMMLAFSVVRTIRSIIFETSPKKGTCIVGGYIDKEEPIIGKEEEPIEIFNEFVEYYKRCVAYTYEPCSCDSFDYTKIPEDYRIELRQEKNNVVISLLKKRFLALIFGFGTVKEEEIENNILCSYNPSTKERKNLGDFKIEKSLMEDDKNVFSYEDKIFLMKYDRLHNCFSEVAPDLENYNEFMELERCIVKKLAGSVVRIEGVGFRGIIMVEGKPEQRRGTTDGSGFLIYEPPTGFQLRLVSVAHVEARSLGPRFFFSNSNKLNPSLFLKRNNKSDLILFQTYLDREDYPFLDFDDFSDEISVGEEVFVLGYSADSEIIEKREGKILEIRHDVEFEEFGAIFPELIIASSLIEEGFSGSPLFNSEGKVVGVVSMAVRYEGHAIGKGYAMVVPIKEVKKLIQSW